MCALAVALALAGCATPRSLAPPPAAVPAAPASLPPAWQAPLPHGGSTAALADWWGRWGDPLLPELVAAAQAVHPSAAGALARLERARATRRAAVAAGAPALDAQAAVGGTRSAPGQPSVANASLGLQAQWELDLSGALAAGRRAAEARLAGAEAGWHAARVSLAADTVLAYAALRACEAQAALAEDDSRSRAETARLTGLSAQAGFTAPADAALARAGAAQARANARALQAQCDLAVKTLVELTDWPEAALRERLAASRGRLPEPPAVAPAVLPAALLAQRPDLADAAQAVVAAAAEIDQARAREGVQVGLSGSFGGLTLRTDAFGFQNGAVWSLGPLAVSFPLWDGGRRAAVTDAAWAGYDEAVAQYRVLARRALREVESALVSLQAVADRQADATSAARDLETFVAATAARQRGGLATLFELENARRDALAAQTALVALRREQAEAWVYLVRALGGGWQAGDAPPPPVDRQGGAAAAATGAGASPAAGLLPTGGTAAPAGATSSVAVPSPVKMPSAADAAVPPAAPLPAGAAPPPSAMPAAPPAPGAAATAPAPLPGAPAAAALDPSPRRTP